MALDIVTLFLATWKSSIYVNTFSDTYSCCLYIYTFFHLLVCIFFHLLSCIYFLVHTGLNFFLLIQVVHVWVLCPRHADEPWNWAKQPLFFLYVYIKNNLINMKNKCVITHSNFTSKYYVHVVAILKGIKIFDTVNFH